MLPGLPPADLAGRTAATGGRAAASSVQRAWLARSEDSRRAAEAGLTRAQEREALALAVGRLVALKPDVVLVERTVAQAARHAFRAAGVAVALNVKRSLLEALARVTGAEVRRSWDASSWKWQGWRAPQLCTLRGDSEKGVPPGLLRGAHRGAVYRRRVAAVQSARVSHMSGRGGRQPHGRASRAGEAGRAAQIAPSAEQASQKCIGTCKEFSLEEAFPRFAAPADAAAAPAAASGGAAAGRDGGAAAAPPAGGGEGGATDKAPGERAGPRAVPGAEKRGGRCRQAPWMPPARPPARLSTWCVRLAQAVWCVCVWGQSSAVMSKLLVCGSDTALSALPSRLGGCWQAAA